MNKKILLLGVSIVVGSAMLVTTAFASMTGNTGYDIYKEAIKNTVQAKSFTADMHFNVKDNGVTLADAAAVMKTDRDGRAISNVTTMKTQDKELTMETYANEESVVLKKGSSDEYYVIKNDRKEFRRHGREFHPEQEQEMSKAGEAVLDALVGDLKNYVQASSNSDGSTNVSIRLEDNQIPAVVNAVAALGVKNAGNEEFKNHKHRPAPFEENFEFEHPKLVEDIKITKVDVKAKINSSKIIESQIVTAVLTGKDAEGKAHEVEFTVDMNLADVNGTIVDKIDLTGKQVKEIKAEDMKHDVEE